MKSQYKPAQLNLSMEKVEKIINGTSNLRDKIIIGSLYFPGLRRFEVAKMKISDVNFEEKTIDVIGKGDKHAIIPVGSLFPQYMADLKHYINSLQHKEGYLFKTSITKFTTKKGELRVYKDGKPIEMSRINQILSKVAKQVKVDNPNKMKKHVNPHLLRHSLARHLKDLRFPIEFIQNYMRHSSIKTTMDIYGKLGLDDMKRIAEEKVGVLE